MWLHLDVLVPERISQFWRYEGKVGSLLSKNGGKSSLLLRVADGQRMGNKHLTLLSGVLLFSAATTSAVLQLCSKT